jgi:hypothetical protein
VPKMKKTTTISLGLTSEDVGRMLMSYVLGHKTELGLPRGELTITETKMAYANGQVSAHMSLSVDDHPSST